MSYLLTMSIITDTVAATAAVEAVRAIVRATTSDYLRQKYSGNTGNTIVVVTEPGHVNVITDHDIDAIQAIVDTTSDIIASVTMANPTSAIANLQSSRSLMLEAETKASNADIIGAIKTVAAAALCVIESCDITQVTSAAIIAATAARSAGSCADLILGWFVPVRANDTFNLILYIYHQPPPLPLRTHNRFIREQNHNDRASRSIVWH